MWGFHLFFCFRRPFSCLPAVTYSIAPHGASVKKYNRSSTKKASGDHEGSVGKAVDRHSNGLKGFSFLDVYSDPKIPEGYRGLSVEFRLRFCGKMDQVDNVLF
jgi:hypothetical protein